MLRDLSVSLDNVGRVAQAQGEWNERGSGVSGKPGDRRQLVERLGGTPESLRDLSVSLDNVGRGGAGARGVEGGGRGLPGKPGDPRANWWSGWAGRPRRCATCRSRWTTSGQGRAGARARGRAEAGYRESLAIRRQLVERLGGTPEALRDLSISLDNVGRRRADARASGRAREPRTGRAWRSARQLVERLGGDARRRCATCRFRWTTSAGSRRRKGEWQRGRRTAYRKAWRSRGQLVERLGGTPESLRDLSVSLDNVGRVAQAQGEWGEAGAAYRESLAIARQLVERLGGRRRRCATCRSR